MTKKLLLTGCLAFLLAGCAPTVYDSRLGEADIKQLLADNNIEICTETAVSTDFSPGLLEGKSWTLSTDCVMNPQAMRVTALKFDSAGAVNTAIRNISSIHRNGFGPHFAYSWGPYVISFEGDRPFDLQQLVGKALTEAGANP